MRDVAYAPSECIRGFLIGKSAGSKKGPSTKQIQSRASVTKSGSLGRDLRSGSVAQGSIGSVSSATGLTYPDKVRLFNLLEQIKEELRNMNALLRKKFGD